MIQWLKGLIASFLYSTYVNEAFTIKSQLLISFICLSIITTGVTLGICIGMLSNLGNEAFSSTTTVVMNTMKDSLYANSQNFASAIDRNLKTIAETVTMQSSLYAQKTYQTLPVNSQFALDPIPYYKEYKFISPCSTPDCPDDFGALAGRSRFPPIPGFIDGSIKHSSVYLYSSDTDTASRNDLDWATTIGDRPYLEDLINSNSYQDSDFDLIYRKGPQSTIMFYLSAKVWRDSSISSYNNVHRTFPGIVKSQKMPITNAFYDGSKRTWFIKAPENNVYIYGPYIETFTQQKVLTVSSKKKFFRNEVGSGSTFNGEFVSAAVILLDDIQKLVGDIQYPYGGYGVLVNEENEVIVYKNASYNTYDATANTPKFKTLYDMMGIDSYHINDCFDYTDNDGVNWVGCSCDFFTIQEDGVGGTRQALRMFTFANKDEALKSLNPLEDNIQVTTEQVTSRTLIISGVILGCMIILTFAFLAYLILPLSPLLDISKRIVAESAVPEDQRDFYPVLTDALKLVNNKTNEVGILLNEYFNVVCILHNRVSEKKKTPKIKENTFFLSLGPDEVVFWDTFFAYFREFVPYGESGNPGLATAGAGGPAAVVDSGTVSSEKDIEFGTDMLADIDISKINKKKTDDKKHYLQINQGEKDSDGSKVLAVDVSIRSEPEITPVISSEVKFGFSFYLYVFVALLMSGSIIIAVYTLVNLDEQGHSWMSNTESKFIQAQKLNLKATVDIKSAYVKSFFDQFILETELGAWNMYSIFENQFISSNNVPAKYLESFALDKDDEYSQYVSSDTTHSGYFDPQVNTMLNPGGTNITETDVQDSYETQLSSMLDLRFSSFFHAMSILSFIQYGAESSGFTRYIPYSGISSYQFPTSCKIDDTTYVSCQSNYLNSDCHTPGHTPAYKPYDPRCRSWYQSTKRNYYKSQNKSAILIFSPRVSSNGQFVLTLGSVVNSSAIQDSQPLPSPNPAGDQLQTGYVFLYNVVADTLASAINKDKILSNGYVYLLKIVNHNSTVVFIHPGLSKTCQDIYCAEGFANEKEKSNFYDNFIYPLADGLSNTNFSTSYIKDGKEWILDCGNFDANGDSYVVVATVSLADVIASSEDLNKSIDDVVNRMIVSCFFSILLFIIFISIVISAIGDSMILPLTELKNICVKISNNDLNTRIPQTIHSYDFKILLASFSELLVALRFGSDSYGRGNVDVARQVFLDAINLFTLTNNKLGIGAAQNNLAAVETSSGNFQSSFANYEKAIENAESIISSPESPNVLKKKFKFVLSDRQGNLALSYLENQQFGKAFEIIESQMKSDKAIGYIRGLVVKQGTLGHYYLKQGEISSARKAFTSAMNFLNTNSGVVDDLNSELWNKEEFGVAEQIARYNMACLQDNVSSVNKSNGSNVAVSAYLDGLCRPSYMHYSTVTKIFASIRAIFVNIKDHVRVKQVDEICVKFGFNQQQKSSSGQGAVKRVAFSVDYSGSMSGAKIKAATSSLSSIISDFINPSDSVMIVKFNHAVNVLFPLKQKEGNEDQLTGVVQNLSSPNGATAFFDSIKICIEQLESTFGGNGNDWIMALTDGEDNQSKMKSDELTKLLAHTSCGANLVIIGVGSDVQTDVLVKLCKATPKGFYLSSSDNASGIKEAFGKAVAVIQGQIVLEDL